ncbi:thioesterase family protein [Desulfococcaceae bacterium HSG8]|nr:thioesterase family protein [Desulfococcaceae bacterium HSG8]
MKPENPRFHTCSLRVPLYEIDLGQGVYHGNYYHLFEIAREAFFREIGFPYKSLMEMQLHLTVAEALCKYKESLHYDEQIDIHTSVSWVRDRSLGVVQRVYKKDKAGNPLLCTDLSLNLVCVRFGGGAFPLPTEFAGCLERYTQPFS